ncbi:MAG: 50S ribosomal protein L29 [Candidatus Nomurabacteria bacterium]|jgi:large subunit ribosomal protein L29|nr:50S ribosomal protein L29 [Candidatus Nomurabacteria bacterium]
MAKALTVKDLREMTPEKLTAQIADLQKDLTAAQKSLADQSLPNPRVISKTRREIARAKTILNEKKKEEK